MSEGELPDWIAAIGLPVAYPLLIAATLVLFWCLSVVCEERFVPALSARRPRPEPDVALELGNGDLQAMEQACAGKPDEAACAKAFEATLEAAARMS